MLTARSLIGLLFLLLNSCGDPNSSTLNINPVADPFPSAPHVNVTPGSLCESSSQYRYPEHIPYCRRSVSSGTKYDVIRDYDRLFGYSISQMDRMEFKVDHLIPLCMGGSNKTDNLWPQHQSIYEQTDWAEPRLCELMAQGKMLRAAAVERIMMIKIDLSKVEELRSELDEM